MSSLSHFGTKGISYVLAIPHCRLRTLPPGRVFRLEVGQVIALSVEYIVDRSLNVIGLPKIASAAAA